MTNLRRRELLRAGVTLSACLLAPPLIVARSRRRWAANPFSLGVAAGAPTADGFTLWTRLAPDPLSIDPDAPGGMRGPNVPLKYEIYGEETLRKLVRRGSCIAEARFGYSVHVDVAGLAPGRPFWYRFISGVATSGVGRALSAPARGAKPSSLKLGFVSCSNYEQGYFSAYRHLADEAPDLAIFLGDYIYENIDRSSATVRSHSDGVAADSLSLYRNRYAQYRLDPDLQRLHAQVPALMTWDDHEVENDYADDRSPSMQDPRAFLARRAAAYQAYYEHMPVRALRSRPDGPVMRLYDRFAFGDLAQILLLDGRQYRSAQPCAGPGGRGGARQQSDSACPQRLDASRSLLGEAQESWLFDTLRDSSTRWQLLAQDVMLAQFQRVYADRPRTFWSDDWNGYPAARNRLLRFMNDQRVQNPVFISGDIHSFWCNDLKADFDVPNSATIATEFVGTSVSALPPSYDTFGKFLPDNPHVRYFESRSRGYATLDIGRDNLQAKFRAVSDARDQAASVSTLKSFVVETGKPGAVAI